MARLVTISRPVSGRGTTLRPQPKSLVKRRLTGAQLRAARGLLGVSAEELASDAGLSLRTIRRAEQDHGPVQIKEDTEERIVSVLEARGAVFVSAGPNGEGVRLRVDPPPRFGLKPPAKTAVRKPGRSR